MRGKSIIVWMMLCVLLLGTAGIGFTKECPMGKKGEKCCGTEDCRHKGKRGGMRKGKRMEYMAKKLDLTDAQKDQIEKIHEDGMKEYEEMMKEVKEKTKKMKEESQEKVKAVLTPEQLKKYEEMHKEKKGKVESKKSKKIRAKIEKLEKELRKLKKAEANSK